jgi:hypothetical protein
LLLGLPVSGVCQLKANPLRIKKKFFFQFSIFNSQF